VSTISGRKVLASGVAHLVGSEVLSTGTNPDISFRHGGDEGEGTIAPNWNGHTLEITSFLAPTQTYSAVITGDPAGIRQTVAFSFERIAELRAGPFYEFRYTISEG
jgi:hypothetical protein